MNHLKIIRNTLLTLAAAFVLFFAPVDENKASASAAYSVDELKSVSTKYLGVRYSYGGSSSNGFDCSGYVRQVFKEVGITSLDRTSSGMYGQGTAVKKSDLQTGDLVFFNTSGKGVSHVGIYIGSGNFIHASTSKGVVKTSINDKAYWGNKYVGAKRIANFSPGVDLADDGSEVDNTPEGE
ncbi:hydrolase [Solibacillus sp. R5-41]|uniref:C40 family peptidase n=1 Tax=Solibacillus sp. R5-41 TaxID=2048654 RepID=UPI000C12471D|nr:C40 family peptidase [Solibacillus sp. R5-41]ATP39054.1 hydrolase [Solibacillus sp. R5-41]